MDWRISGFYVFIFDVVCGQRRVLSGVLLEFHGVDVCMIMGGVDGGVWHYVQQQQGRCLFALAYGSNVGWKTMT